MTFLTDSFHIDALIFILIVSTVIWKYLTWTFNYWQKRNVPYVEPIPFFGNVFDAIACRRSVGDTLFDLYGKLPSVGVFGIWIFRTPSLILRSPEMIKLIAVKDFHYFINRSVTCLENSVFSSMLLLAQGNQWHMLRKKTTTIFTSNKLRNFTSLINDCAKNLNAFLLKASAQEALDTKELASKYATEVITSYAFGIEAHCFKSENAPFHVIAMKMFEVTFGNGFRVISWYLMPWIVSVFRVPFFHWDIIQFCRETFWQIIEDRTKSGKKRNDVIDLVIEMMNSKESNVQRFTDADFASAILLQFLAAGIETVTTTLTFALYELAINIKCQTRLREELHQLIDGDQDLTYDTIKEFKYLSQVINETLRKYPPLPFLDRRCVQNYKMPNSDLIIEKGTPIYIPIRAMHYDEQNFVNPKRFDPDRFNIENIGAIKPYTYLPFGVGPRNCIGESLGLLICKLAVAHIISDFRVILDERTPKEIDFDPRGFVLIPKSTILLKYIPIKK